MMCLSQQREKTVALKKVGETTVPKTVLICDSCEVLPAAYACGVCGLDVCAQCMTGRSGCKSCTEEIVEAVRAYDEMEKAYLKALAPVQATLDRLRIALREAHPHEA